VTPFCRNKKALAGHMDQVHPKVPFKCDLCGIYIKTKEHPTEELKD